MAPHQQYGPYDLTGRVLKNECFPSLLGSVFSGGAAGGHIGCGGAILAAVVAVFPAPGPHLHQYYPVFAVVLNHCFLYPGGHCGAVI